MHVGLGEFDREREGSKIKNGELRIKNGEVRMNGDKLNTQDTK